MKILQVIPAVAERYGGPSKLVIELCRALRQKHIDTEIATSDADGPTRLDVERNKLINYRGIPTRFFRRDFSEAFKYSRGLAAWLGRNICNYDLAHIHAVFSHSSLAAAAACRTNDVPYIVRPLGTLDPWSMGVKPLRKKFFWRFGVERMLHNAAAIHYTTEIERREVEASLGLSRGVVIPNAVDIDSLRAGLSIRAFAERFPMLAECPYILFMGRLHPKKNLELLVQAFADGVDTTEEGVLPQLVIAGTGAANYRLQLEEFAARTSAADRILFPGWLQGVEKNAILHRAKLFVLPSLDENFGISVVEAMACSTPVLVSTGVYLHEEVARAQAGWVWDGTQEALSGTLNKAMRSKTLLQLGMQGRNLVDDRFSWDRVVSDLENTYRKTVQVD